MLLLLNIWRHGFTDSVFIIITTFQIGKWNLHYFELDHSVSRGIILYYIYIYTHTLTVTENLTTSFTIGYCKLCVL